MSRRLILRPEAQDDLEAAVFHYETERSGLGARLLEAFDALFERIRENPFQFSQVEEGVRRALCRRFPFGAYFTFGADDVVVLALLHLHRHPDSWKSGPRRA